MSGKEVKKTLVVIIGATATGKTGMSVEIARRLGTEIISCDSRQIYREIPIGTAAPDREQLSLVPHHFIATRSVTDFYTAGQFEKDALELLDKLFEKHDTVVMTGGSGLYVDAVCDGFDKVPSTNPGLREELVSRIESEGLESLLEDLRKLDPEYYEIVDRHNTARVTRALEVCLSTGKTYTELRKRETAKRSFDIIKIGISMPRDVLYERINRRVDIMIGQGLEDEVKSVFHLREHNALRTVGYREFFEHLEGRISREEAIGLIKRNSRRYAKRQVTWFGRDERIKWFDTSSPDEIEAYIRERLE